MSFPRYPQYRDSGVEWLGEVPGHWEVKSIRYILNAIGDVDHFMPVSVESGVPYLMTGDLKDLVSDVRLEDCKQVSRDDYLQLSKRIGTSKGDVVMARYATIGTLMYVDADVEFLVSYSCVTLKTNPSKMSGMYLFQYMKSAPFRRGIEHQTNTNTQGNVGIKDLQGLKVAAPPVDEQAAIAAFLNRETAKIDALVAEQEKLIALLKEKRQAVISHTVTKGLDASVSMKDSGVEWLGVVPAHWGVVPLGKVTVARCDGPFGSGLKSEHYTDAGVRVVRLQNVRSDGFNGVDEAFIAPDYYDRELSGHDVIAGDVLIAGLGDECAREGATLAQ